MDYWWRRSFNSKTTKTNLMDFIVLRLSMKIKWNNCCQNLVSSWNETFIDSMSFFNHLNNFSKSFLFPELSGKFSVFISCNEKVMKFRLSLLLLCLFYDNFLQTSMLANRSNFIMSHYLIALCSERNNTKSLKTMSSIGIVHCGSVNIL